MFGIQVLLGVLDQEDGNRQCISTCIKQDFDVEFSLENLTAEEKSIYEGNINAVRTGIGCEGEMDWSDSRYVQGWIL